MYARNPPKRSTLPPPPPWPEVEIPIANMEAAREKTARGAVGMDPNVSYFFEGRVNNVSGNSNRRFESLGTNASRRRGPNTNNLRQDQRNRARSLNAKQIFKKQTSFWPWGGKRTRKTRKTRKARKTRNKSRR